MSFSRVEIAGWFFAICGAAIMAFIVFAGPFHKINKVQAHNFPVMTVLIKTDLQTVGKYVPATVTVHLGQQIRFKNVSNADHTVTARNDIFDSGNIATGGATFTLTTSKVGVFHYGCSYHPLMHGIINVLS
ncbi:MAG: cupredoxin domain-containing protein [Chloroflexota bacterium]